MYDTSSAVDTEAKRPWVTWYFSYFVINCGFFTFLEHAPEKLWLLFHTTLELRAHTNLEVRCGQSEDRAEKSAPDKRFLN
ncbi:hypothetical protein GN956_G9199 [Arapaima gigas]